MKDTLYQECLREIRTLKARKKRGEFTSEDENRAVAITEMFASGKHGEDSFRWDVLKNQAWELIVPSLKRY